MKNKTTKISLVFPVFNEEENIELLYIEVYKIISQLDVDYELIFVDDGSVDNSLNIIKNLREKDKKVSYVSLSRNFGHQNALFAGLSRCRGDAVITMDADLQHPPSLISKMIEEWKKGSDIVYTVKGKISISLLKKTLIRMSYWFISKVSGLALSFGQSDFRLIDKKVLKALLEMPEYHKFLRGQVSWLGFKQKGIKYDVEKRHAGKPKYSYNNLYNLALNGIFSFGRYPLHLFMLLGFFLFLVSLLGLLYVLYLLLLRSFNILTDIPPGWITLTFAVFLFGGIQVMATGILGEYIGRIYDQTKNRPVFIVRESSEIEKTKE